jgi:hypothetical protein
MLLFWLLLHLPMDTNPLGCLDKNKVSLRFHNMNVDFFQTFSIKYLSDKKRVLVQNKSNLLLQIIL